MCKQGETCACKVPCERCISVTVANNRGKIIFERANMSLLRKEKQKGE